MNENNKQPTNMYTPELKETIKQRHHLEGWVFTFERYRVGTRSILSDEAIDKIPDEDVVPFFNNEKFSFTEFPDGYVLLEKREKGIYGYTLITNEVLLNTITKDLTFGMGAFLDCAHSKVRGVFLLPTSFIEPVDKIIL